jgi:hypothetical protein
MKWLIPLVSMLTLLWMLFMTFPVAAVSSDTQVSVGSPTTPFT